MEWWLLAVPIVIWMYLSMGAHRREKQRISELREQMLSYVRAIKLEHDRFVANQTSLEKLAFQLRQLDEKGEVFQEDVFPLLSMHQHEA